MIEEEYFVSLGVVTAEPTKISRTLTLTVKWKVNSQDEYFFLFNNNNFIISQHHHHHHRHRHARPPLPRVHLILLLLLNDLVLECLLFIFFGGVVVVGFSSLNRFCTTLLAYIGTFFVYSNKRFRFVSLCTTRRRKRRQWLGNETRWDHVPNTWLTISWISIRMVHRFVILILYLFIIQTIHLSSAGHVNWVGLIRGTFILFKTIQSPLIEFLQSTIHHSFTTWWTGRGSLWTDDSLPTSRFN